MKSTQANSKVFKTSKARLAKEEMPFGNIGQANVSRIKVAKTQIPVEARSQEQMARMGNVVQIEEAYVEDVRKSIETRARKFRDKITGTMIATAVGFDQALDWSLVMLKDGFGINGSISIDIQHLLDAASNIAMLEHIAASLHMSKEVKAKMMEAAIERAMDQAYAQIAKAKGGARTANPMLAGMITDPQLRQRLRERDRPQFGGKK
jgi:hypothetical protein